jgi:hypothetical protein
LSKNSPERRGKANPSNSGKRKMISIQEPIPKKPRRDAKHCTLYKKDGSVHAMHNMSDCCKYEKDGKRKKSFGKGQRGNRASNKKTASAFTQLLAKIAKFEKANENLKATAMTPIPLEGVGPVAHGGATVENLKLLVIHR